MLTTNSTASAFTAVRTRSNILGSITNDDSMIVDDKLAELFQEKDQGSVAFMVAKSETNLSSSEGCQVQSKWPVTVGGRQR